MLLMYHPHNKTCFHLQGSQPCHLATPNPEIMIIRFRPSLHEQCLVPSQHPNDRLVVTSNGLARVLSRKYKDGVLCLGVSDNHANSHFYFAGPDVTTVCPDVPKEIRDPLTGPPSHWSPISLVPFSLVPHGGPMRWGTSEMGDHWDLPKMGGLMKRGTNEKGDQWVQIM